MSDEVEVLPCPCCGASEVNVENGLYVGPLGDMKHGVQCMSCGLTIRRDMPDEFLPETRNQSVDEALAALYRITTERAIQAWNRRV